MHTYTQVHMNEDIVIDIEKKQEHTQSNIILSKCKVQRDYMK